MPRLSKIGAASLAAFGFTAGGAASGYTLTKSLRFRSSASAYLSRTPASASNRTVWTWSGWVKRGNLSTYQALFDVYIDTNNASVLDFTDTNNLRLNNLVAGTAVTNKITSAVYRDPAAWYHVVVSSNGATALNLYVNGVQVTSWGTNTGPDASNWFFNSTNVHWIGREQYSTTNYYADNYLTNVQFVDGQALTASSFGAADATTGVWQPIAYTGTYGTNGFYLPFTNTTSTATLGNDSSGNSNTWTVNNISLTTGTTYDSMTDVPTLTSTTAANYATFNPLYIDPKSSIGIATITNGNLKATTANNTINNYAVSTIGVTSGKWYFEATIGQAANANSFWLGFIPLNSSVFTYYRAYGADGQYYNGTAWVAYAAAYTAGDVIGIALDMDAQTLTFYKNNTSQGQKTSIGLSGQTMFGIYNSQSTGDNASINFGQQPFTYTPPSGFVALNTYNL